MFNDIIFENHVAYKIMWKNTIQPDRPQIEIWLMRKVCWISKVLNTHSEYVTRIGFPCKKVPWIYLSVILYIQCLLLYFILQKPRKLHHVWLIIAMRKAYQSGGELQFHQRKKATWQLITSPKSYLKAGAPYLISA
jgi:hypothetical protein